MVIHILVSRNKRTGLLDARPFAQREEAEAFRDEWEREEPGRHDFRVITDHMRMVLYSGTRKREREG